MEKKILFLIKVNIITYLNNLLYTIITSKRELDGPIVFWALSPLLFLSITSFILAFNANPEYKIFKTEAIIDYIIRLIGCGIGFLNYKIEFMSQLFMIKIIIIFVLFLFNILLEIRIYNKVKITFTKEEYDVKEHINITPELKKNIRNTAYAVTLGLVSFYLFVFLGLPITITRNIAHTVYFRTMLFIISVLSFIWFLIANFMKCNLFYTNKEEAKKIFRKDIILVVYSYGFCLMVALGVFGESTLLTYLSPIISILSMLPVIKTNRQMAITADNVRKALGEEFILSFIDE